MHQRLTQMKSETASFPHESAADSINIRDCKFLPAATNLASASDAFDSEYASFPPSQGGTLFHKKCFLCLPLTIMAMYDDQIQ